MRSEDNDAKTVRETWLEVARSSQAAVAARNADNRHKFVQNLITNIRRDIEPRSTYLVSPSIDGFQWSLTQDLLDWGTEQGFKIEQQESAPGFFDVTIPEAYLKLFGGEVK